MKQRGGLAYYPAAVVCGSFFLTLVYYPYIAIASHLRPTNWARSIILFYFVVVLAAAVSLLLGAWLLRWMARRQQMTTAAQWMAGGVVAFAVVVGAEGALLLLLKPQSIHFFWLRAVYADLLIGPAVMLRMPLWLPLPATVATGYVLFLIQRAFTEKAS